MEAKISCGRDRVLRIMRQADIEAQRGYGKPKNMYVGKPHTLIPNTLDRESDETPRFLDYYFPVETF